MLSEYTEIQKLLLRLGATPNYAGFHYVSYAVQLSLEQEQRLLCVTKFLYPDVARHYHTSWMAVERDMRTLIVVVWKTNPHFLNELAGYTLQKKPSPGQFLAILTGYLSLSGGTARK